MNKMGNSEHYKMYKAGKLWLTAAITVLAFTGMTASVKADDQGTKPTSTQQVVPSGSAVASTVSATTGMPASGAAPTTPAASPSVPTTANTEQANVSESGPAEQNEEPQLDNNLLSRAGSFHIFANEVRIGADVNGNIATRHYVSGNEFGTREESHNYKLAGKPVDVSYIESFDQLGANAFRNKNDDGDPKNDSYLYIAFGDQAWDKIKIENNQVFANGTRLDKLNNKADAVHHEKLIDFDQEFKTLNKLADFYARQEATKGVKVDFHDMNNRTIDVSGVDPETKIIYANVPAEYLSAAQPLTIKGLSTNENGPVVILNVVFNSTDDLFIGTQTRLVYTNGQMVNVNEKHDKPNHVIWNFGTGKRKLNVNSGYFLGSVLAPQSELNAGVNMDGNLIADHVNVTGGETHRWDLRGTIPRHHHIPYIPENLYPVIPHWSQESSQPSMPSTSTPSGQSSHQVNPSSPSGQSSQVTNPSTPSGQSSHQVKPSSPSGQSSQVTNPSTPSGQSSHQVNSSSPSGQSSQVTNPSTPSGQSSQSTKPSVPSSQSSQASKPSVPTSQSSQATKPSVPTSQSSQASKPSVPTSQSSQASKPSVPSSQSSQASKPSVPTSQIGRAHV